MGAHGASGEKDGFIGSNTYTLIKNATVPILSIPLLAGRTPFKKLSIPFDLWKEST